MEKDFETVILYDVYAALLTEKQQRLCDMYYNHDYSLAEIAAIEKTSRQAARDGIGKAKQRLKYFEACLLLCEKKEAMTSAIEDAAGTACKHAQAAMRRIADIWEITDGI